MADFPRFTDLRAIAAEIGSQNEYKRVQTAIDRASRAQSCVSDLAEAETCCEALSDLLKSPRKQGTMTRLATEAALLRTAVTLYERATAAGAKKGERGSIQIVDHLTKGQQQDHDTLIAVRHRSLAHVYVGEAIDGQVWNRDILFAVEEPAPAWHPAAASQRIQFHRGTFSRLKRQIPVALSLVKKRFDKRLGELQCILNDNPLPIEVFESHQFDPLVEFGGEEAVRQLLKARTLGGRASFAA